MEQLRQDSSVLDFAVPQRLFGGPPEAYLVRFRGLGLYRDPQSGQILVREDHEVSIQLGAAYPRMMPELSWRTPMFHPNISSSGVVCLGGYAAHWVPSLNLDELCTMLWDMLRYRNYDVDSPYNRDAAQWVRSQRRFHFPIDNRPIRDRLAAGASTREARGERSAAIHPQEVAVVAARDHVNSDDVRFLHDQSVIDAELVEPDHPDILFIE
jgi:hypothetical protein